MIETLLVDFFDVLTAKGGYVYASEQLNILTGIPKQTIFDTLEAEDREYVIGKETTRGFWERINKTIPVPFERFAEIIGTYELNKEVMDILSRYKERVKLILISDNYEMASSVAENDTELNALFDTMFFSNNVGLMKKNQTTDFYLHVLKEINCEASKAIFIDNNLSNVTTAATTGLKTILYTSPHQLEKDLFTYF